MRVKIQLLLISVGVLCIAGCNKWGDFSPEKVLENTLAEKDALTYYGEIELTGVGIVVTEIVENAVMKEWRDHGRSRVEVETGDGKEIVVVEDGKSLISYDATEKKAQEIDFTEEETLQFEPREQLTTLLSMLQDTHDVKTLGEETYLGRPTIHLEATQKPGKKNILGNLEMWIDREHWMVLKIMTTSGDLQMNLAYTKIDFNASLDDSLFQLPLPDDVAVEKVDDDWIEGETILPETIPDKFQQTVLTFPQANDWTIENATFIENEGAFGHVQIAKLKYKRNGLPSMTLIIQANDLEDLNEEMEATALKLLDGISEKVTVRKQAGRYYDGMGMNLLEWKESGLTYSIDIIDPSLTVEEVLQLTETMEEIK